jgi:hypothetical protein
MTLDNPDHATQSNNDGATCVSTLITIQVTTAGSISPPTYAAYVGDTCTVAPAFGSSFNGNVYVKDSAGNDVATWATGPSWPYAVPSVPGIYTLTTKMITGSNGTINIGTRPPLMPPSS